VKKFDFLDVYIVIHWKTKRHVRTCDLPLQKNRTQRLEVGELTFRCVNISTINLLLRYQHGVDKMKYKEVGMTTR
jgi:hypothetical protein